MRLHLLAAEAAAHPQALDGHRVVGPAEDVGHDLLRLGGVLGAALHEHLPRLVDVGERALGLEVEVLLPGHLDLAAEHPRRRGQSLLDVASLDRRLPALEAARRDRLPQADHGGQWLVVDLDRRGAQPRGLEGLGEHPADGMAVVHHLAREQRLVVLHPRVVDPGDVVGGQDPDHPGDVVGRVDAQAGHPGVGVGRLHRMGVQDVAGAADEVVGVERRTGDVQGRALVGDGQADGGVVGSLREVAHAGTASLVSAHSRSSALPSIAER